MANLHLNTYDDVIDYSREISLYEYNIVRRSKDNKYLICRQTIDDVVMMNKKPEHEVVYISKKDIIEALNDYADDSFYSFVGTDKETYINELTDTNIAHAIQSLGCYYGWDTVGLD